MKVSIYGREAFPVYEVHESLYDESCYPVIEVSDDVLARWKSIFELFETMQKEIIYELKSQGQEDQIWAGSSVYNGWHSLDEDDEPLDI
jgi:hypothetical protein